MGKLSYGIPSQHILKSQGGDSDVMKFYCTQNSTTYGQKWSKFQPRTGKHTGTGYQSNFRPGVYYSGRLDQVDNPAMGRIVSDNYHTITEKSFRPYTGPSGREPLPNSCLQVGSGFVREKPLTFPGTEQGPGYMTTETHQKFRGQQPDRRDLTTKPIGNKEDSGFTHAYGVEPITFHPNYAHRGDFPGYLTDRPTGVPIMKSDYRPTEFPKGDDALPKIANRSDRDSGFTNGTNSMPAYAIGKPENPHTTAGDTYQGKQLPAKTESDRLGRTQVGFKEPTGYGKNNDGWIAGADDPGRFLTHYNSKFLDRTAEGLNREGHTWGGVLPQKEDGFTKSTSVHSNGAIVDTTATLRHLEPYVARSIKARDVYYDDHLYDSRIHSKAAAMMTA